MTNPSDDKELREKFRDIIGFQSPELIESTGIIGLNLPANRFEEILDKLLSAVQAFCEQREREQIVKTQSATCDYIVKGFNNAVADYRDKYGEKAANDYMVITGLLWGIAASLQFPLQSHQPGGEGENQLNKERELRDFETAIDIVNRYLRWTIDNHKSNNLAGFTDWVKASVKTLEPLAQRTDSREPDTKQAPPGRPEGSDEN